jgi:hypothetical protein
MSDLERVVITPQPVEAPEGHDEKMIALAEGVETPENPEVKTEDRPAWLPSEFNSVEEFTKAYNELKTGKQPEADPKASTEIPEQSDANKALESKGLNLADFSKEFNETGALSEDSYAKLAAAGFDRNVVDSYVAGQQALANQYAASIKAEVGGDDKYTEIVNWAKANLTPAEIKAYNSAVDSGDAAQAKLAVLGLSTKFTKAVGSEPNLQTGKAVSASEDVFESTAQLTAAMRDPRYRNDPAYRAKVQAKLSRSNIF